MPAEDKPLHIDFHGEKICKFMVNGELPVHVDFDKHRILIPSDLLKEKNVISLDFHNKYVNNSAGLHL